MASLLKIWIVFGQKYEKWKLNEKLSIKCKYIVERSYMFISASEIGQLTRTSCVWLDWIDYWSFILDYGLVHTWPHTHHTSLMFNECLFHLCVVCVQMWCVYSIACWSNPIFFFIVFFMFLKVFLCFYVFRVLSKMSVSFLSKKISRGIFVNKSRLNTTRENKAGKFQITLKFRQRVLWLAREKMLPAKIVSMFQWLFREYLHEKLTHEMCDSIVLKPKSDNFFFFSNHFTLPPPCLS